MPKSTYLHLSEQRKQDIKERIMDLFIKNPYESVNIRDIAAHAGFSIGSFYKYFEDKDEMYLHFLTEVESKISYSYQKSTLPKFIQYAFYPEFKQELNEKEYLFDQTWTNAPISVYYKFYFEGYCRKTLQFIVEDLKKLESENKLKPGLDIDTCMFIISSSLFSLWIYLKQNNLSQDLHHYLPYRTYLFKEIVLPSILSKEYYRDVEYMMTEENVKY